MGFFISIAIGIIFRIRKKIDSDTDNRVASDVKS